VHTRHASVIFGLEGSGNYLRIRWRGTKPEADP
jgi:hypothetical protein